jgi:uracil-DNA glycosylase
MPTYHPAFLLRNAEMKRPVWEDLQKVSARLATLRGGAA